MSEAAIAGAGKQGTRRGVPLVFVEEAGFSLLPFVVPTHAPRGQTPVLAETFTRDHLAFIRGVTPQGHLVLQIDEGPLARVTNAADQPR